MPVRRIDVAREAGTSPAVVSYVLNDGPRGVAPETRERVLTAVEKLGYRPNGVARSLRMSRTMTLGLVVPDASNPFFAELGRAIEEAAYARGYTLLVGNAAEQDERQTAYVQTFLQRQVDGLILAPAHGPVGCIQDLDHARTPWLTVDRGPVAESVPSVLVDNRVGARAATEHLLAHGRRRVACIGGPEDVMPAADRVAGWRDALVAAGEPTDAVLVRHARFGRRAGYLAARELFDQEEPDAVFVASDEQALGVLRAVAEAGLRCPDDIAIASFDGIAAAAYATPALTTAAQPFARLGATAVEQLVARIEDREPTDDATVLPVELLRRGSCGCDDPPGGDHLDYDVDEEARA